MDKVGEIIKSNQTPQSGGSTTTALASRKNSGMWVQRLEQMAFNMRQDWAPGQITYWATELKQYSDDEILVALGLYTGEFFPNVKQIREIIDRKREMVSNRAWDKWKAEDAEGKRATPEEIAEMIRGCNRAWDKAAREGRLASSGRSNGAASNVEANKQSATPANARTPESTTAQKVG